MKKRDRQLIKWFKRLHPNRKRTKHELKLWASKHHHIYVRFHRECLRRGIKVPDQEQFLESQRLERLWKKVGRMAVQLAEVQGITVEEMRSRWTDESRGMSYG